MKIAILDDYQQVLTTLNAFKLLKGQDVRVLHLTEKDPAVLAASLKDVEILVLTRERTAISEALLSKLPGLKLISQTGKIAKHLDLAVCTRYGVAVAEGTGSPVAPAELTWALIMNTVRRLPQAIEGMKAGKWQINMGSCIHGKTVGIWGYGKIGRIVAGYAKAFGATVLVWGSAASRQQAESDGFLAARSKAAFFESADIVSLHLRLNAATVASVRKSDLAMMKPTAAIINTSRAELIEKGALVECLQQGRPGFAGLDVYESEPVYDPEFPLLKLPGVVCTPHLGYVEKQSYELYFGKAFENVMAFISGHPQNIANPEVLHRQ